MRGSARLADGSTDVVVIGGGAIGCATAWELARRGARVTLLERGVPGRESTWAAAGMLSPLGESPRDDAYLALSIASLDRYAAFAESLQAAIGEDLEYRTDGKLYVALEEAKRPALDAVFGRGAAFGVERLDAERARSLEPALSESVTGAVLVRRDHRIDNRRLGAALAAAAASAGVDVRAHTPAREVRTTPRPGGGVAVREVVDDAGTAIPARSVVIAAGAWSGALAGLAYPVPVRPVRGQMFSVRAGEVAPCEAAGAPLLERVIMTSDCYVIPRANGTVLVGATVEDVGFAPGPTPFGIRTLAAAAAAALPVLGELPIVETWAGYRPGTPDEMPILGADPDVEGLYYATGHFRSGILLAPITAEIIADLITGAAPAVEIAPFGVQRFRR